MVSWLKKQFPTPIEAKARYFPSVKTQSQATQTAQATLSQATQTAQATQSRATQTAQATLSQAIQTALAVKTQSQETQTTQVVLASQAGVQQCNNAPGAVIGLEQNGYIYYTELPCIIRIAGFDIAEVSRWFTQYTRREYDVKVAEDFLSLAAMAMAQLRLSDRSNTLYNLAKGWGTLRKDMSYSRFPYANGSCRICFASEQMRKV